MAATITVEEIKGIRGKYGLSQQAFAAALGLGTASVARYEQGAEPSKANANLIRAAANPAFMMECIERDGASLTEKQRNSVARVYYAAISLDPEDEAPEPNLMSEVYNLTLQQEVLNEQAANIACDLMRFMLASDIDARDNSNPASVLLEQIFMVKNLLLSFESDDPDVLKEIQGFIKFTAEAVERLCAANKAA